MALFTDTWSNAAKPQVAGTPADTIQTEAALRALQYFGAGAFLVPGSPVVPNGQIKWLWQAATTPVSTDAGGNATITFPRAFGKGVLAILVTADSGAAAAWVVKSGSATTASFGVIGPALLATSLGWLAIGY